MKNKELQQLLSAYPDNMTVKLMTGNSRDSIKDFDNENIIEWSDTHYVDDEAPEEEWDHEDGKVELGSGETFLLINPVIQ